MNLLAQADMIVTAGSNDISVSKHESMAQRAYRIIRADIISGARPPGERLRIEMLKTIYDIGPTPLREALQKLSTEGLVLALEKRGFMVSPLDLDEFSDLNIARIEIEKVALSRSIALGDRQWESRVVAATYLMNKEDAALLASDNGVSDAWEAANAEFHATMIAACGSKWLLQMRDHLQDMCERYRRSSISQSIRKTGNGKRDVGKEHAAISNAVLARDARLACQLTESHYMKTLDRLKRDLKKVTKPQT
ncbi:MAG: FCD domain-containing protein [Proteobacteria bacterium]|nr:FCD domain-containing protein [Pseudomonadota bacterium]MDA0961166.1 FCD domain-containing protein [Pseudomonadota bacterium]